MSSTWLKQEDQTWAKQGEPPTVPVLDVARAALDKLREARCGSVADAQGAAWVSPRDLAPGIVRKPQSDHLFGANVTVHSNVPDGQVYAFRQGDETYLAVSDETYKTLLREVDDRRPGLSLGNYVNDDDVVFKDIPAATVERWAIMDAATGGRQLHRPNEGCVGHCEHELILNLAGWDLLIDPNMEPDKFFVDQAVRRTHVSPETWETLSYSEEATAEFLDDMRQGSGMKRMVKDAGKYREAALAEAKAKGLDQPARKDELVRLREEANTLVIQAASLNKAPTDVQLQAFASRLAHLREEFTAFEQSVADLRSLVELAETAVVDALDG